MMKKIKKSLNCFKKMMMRVLRNLRKVKKSINSVIMMFQIIFIFKIDHRIIYYN